MREMQNRRYWSPGGAFTNELGANPRPPANTLPPGSQIWNLEDNAPNYSDGVNWRDAAGNLT